MAEFKMLCAGMQDGESTLRQEASRNQRTITPPQRPSRLDPASERGRTTNQGVLQQTAAFLQLLLALSCLQCGPVIALLYRQRQSRATLDLYCLLTALAGEGRANGPGRRGQPVSQPQKRPRTDWALGLSVAYDAELLEVRLLLSSALHTLRTAHTTTCPMQGSQSALV